MESKPTEQLSILDRMLNAGEPLRLMMGDTELATGYVMAMNNYSNDGNAKVDITLTTCKREYREYRTITSPYPFRLPARSRGENRIELEFDYGYLSKVPEPPKKTGAELWKEIKLPQDNYYR